jgi:hypothetical protein
MRLFILTSIVAFLATQAYAVENKKFVICKFKGEARMLEIIPGGPEDGCQTMYTKYGKTERVGWGKNFAGCVQILGNVKKNLEGSDWKCKDKTEMRVSAQ